MAHSQSIMNGGLRPLIKWIRFLACFVAVLVIYHLYVGFRPLGNSNLQLLSPQHPMDFSWYKTWHPRLPPTGAINTTQLTLNERTKLQEQWVDRAHRRASLAFAKTSIGGDNIPGSLLQSAQKVRTARAKIDCWTQGRWVPETRDKLILHKQDPLYGSCDKRHSTPRPETQYRWQPSGELCMSPLPTPTRQQWCQVLNGRHILLVGDLLQYQLHELFLDFLREGPTVCYGELNCKDHTICTQVDTRLRYLRNDILADNRQHLHLDDFLGGVSTVTWPFVSNNVLKKYPILLLNRSPVTEDDDTFISTLIQTLSYIRRTMPDILILYRSSPVGHPYCDDADSPLPTPLSDTEKRRLPFGWAEMDRRNAMARVIVEAAGGVYVDLAALVETRPDGHVGAHDCLRYCIPGPLDAWLDVLYQVFTVLEDDPPP